MIKPGSVPQPATTHQQHPPHQSHQLPDVLKRGTRSESPRCYPYSFCVSSMPVFDLMFSASSDAASPVAV